MTPEERKRQQAMMGPVPQPGYGMEDPATFKNQNGGTVTVGRGTQMYQNLMGRANPHANQEFVPEYGKAGSDFAGRGYTNAEAQQVMVEQAKGGIAQRIMSNPDYNKGMYQKPAFTGQIQGGVEGAQARQTAGKMTMDDALALGVRRSRYGDYDTVTEPREPQPVVQPGQRGYGAQQPPPEMRTRPRTAEEWVQAQNQPIIDQQAKDEAAQLAMREAAVKAGSLVPQLDGKGNVMGYGPRPEPNKYLSTGQGVFDATAGAMVPGTGPQKDPVAETAYPWRQGMPAQVMLDQYTVGILNPAKGYYEPQPIKSQKVFGANPKTGKYEEYMAPNFAVEGLPNYADLSKPQAPAAPETSRTFASEDEALASGVKGEVIINGRKALIE